MDFHHSLFTHSASKTQKQPDGGHLCKSDTQGGIQRYKSATVESGGIKSFMLRVMMHGSDMLVYLTK